MRINLPSGIRMEIIRHENGVIDINCTSAPRTYNGLDELLQVRYNDVVEILAMAKKELPELGTPEKTGNEGIKTAGKTVKASMVVKQANKLKEAKPDLKLAEHIIYKVDAPYYSQFSKQWPAGSYKAAKAAATPTDEQSKYLAEAKACYKTCVKMLQDAVQNKGSYVSANDATSKARIQIEQMGTSGKLEQTAGDSFKTGISAIDEALKNNQVIIVGVNHSGRANGPTVNDLGTVSEKKPVTEHFLVIYEKGTDEKGTFYKYYDPGAYPGNAAGTSDENKLYLNLDVGNPDKGTLTGHTGMFGGTDYVATQIRPDITTGK